MKKAISTLIKIKIGVTLIKKDMINMKKEVAIAIINLNIKIG